MKILCKEAFIIIHHGHFCRISLYCTLEWQDPRDAAACHLFWNEQILLRSLSHADFPCPFTATASPLDSITLLLLTSINRRVLQACAAKGSSRESLSLRPILLKDEEKYNKILKQPLKHWSSGDATSFSGEDWKPTSGSSPELPLSLQPHGSQTSPPP